MKKRDWMQHLAERADLGAEPLPGIPLVEIADDSRVLIEYHRGICEYSCNRICVKVRYGKVCVSGACMQLSLISKDRLVISGRIQSVELERS